MAPKSPDTDQLIERAQGGDRTARQDLLTRHRGRLRQMIAVRMDRRLQARMDPSDVVQETLADAWKQFSDYLRDQPLPFYPWLRQLAWKRLVELHRHHIQAQKRSVKREKHQAFGLPEHSTLELVNRLVAKGTSPSGQALRSELHGRVQKALERLPERDREVLVLKYLEQLNTREISAVTGIPEGTVKVRHLRALEKLHRILGDEPSEEDQ